MGRWASADGTKALPRRGAARGFPDAVSGRGRPPCRRERGGQVHPDEDHGRGAQGERPAISGPRSIPIGGIPCELGGRRCEEVVMSAADIVVVVAAVAAVAGLGWFFFGSRKARAA